MKNRALKSIVVMMIAVMVVAMMPVQVSAATKTPAKVKISYFKVGKVSTKNNTCTVTIKWKKAKNATGYVIYAKAGTGKWTKQKKVGKYIRTFKLKKVPAGQFAIKVRAVNKKKNGKFSAVKSKYIKSPLTLQQYIDRVEPNVKNMTMWEGKPSFSGKWMRVDYDLANKYADADTVDWSALTDEEKAFLISELPDLTSKAASFKKSVKLNCGITNAGVLARFVYGNQVVVSKSF